MNLPKQFEDRMKRLLGDEYEDYLRCFNKPYHGGIRVNTLKISPREFEHLCPFSTKKIPWIYNGYYYDTADQPARHPYYYAGLYYIQEPSAMTPASLLPIDPGDKVLDLCAAPGGKSTELGARLMGEGMLVSNDISNSRAKALLKNIELFGIKNSLVLSEAPNKLAEYFPNSFDKILVDAPCSGEGMFRKSPSIIKNWEQYGVDYYNKLQKEIIVFAARMLKPGGMLLYSTCTFSPEENEGTIAYLLNEFPDMHVIEALPSIEERKSLEISFDGFDKGKPEWVNGPEELKNCIRLWPHRIDGEGHFIALLQKDADGDPARITNHIPESFDGRGRKVYNHNKSVNSLSHEAKEFLLNIALLENLDDLMEQERILIQNDRVYLVPENYEAIKELRTLRQGLLLGEMKKKRFQPSQALANALKSSDYECIINLSSKDSEAISYLKCETLSLEDTNNPNGWQLVSVDGYPLGWGKLTNGILKNMYLPGWRWM
ncbi:MAG: NOL1/NOP2/sun family putative RNA methylase [Anaerolineaceae bacterium]|nr:MAG: NOL1/NOP2/sun family putative RNA methylase [Anaerolineaceae bacterium]